MSSDITTRKSADEIVREQVELGRLEDAGDFPSVVLVDTVSYCNLRCSMCVHKEMTRKRGVMTWDLYTKIIDEIAEKRPDARVWLVFFGEPLVIKRKKPSIYDMIRYAKSKGLTDVVVNSNACLMDREAAAKLIEAGLDGIYFGIDAFDAGTYSQLRVGGDYEQTVANVIGLIELKRELEADNPEVFVQFVEMDVNSDQIDDFTAFWNSHGANVKIRPKVSWGGLIEAPNLVLKQEDRWPCYWAMRSLSVTDTGDVVLCPVDLDARCVVGEVRTSSISDVWNGRLKEIRDTHLECRWDDLPEMCRGCGDWQSARAEYREI